jgi:uncharacterized membrane protein HdeD (DUF308 family)
MNELLARSWWMLVLNGIAALLFGVLALIWPALTLLVLVALFAAWAILSGVMAAVAAIRNRNADRGWWLILLLGLVSIAAGIVAVFYPGITALFLVLLMGVNALMSGVLNIAVGVRLRKVIDGEWLLILAGIVSIVFAFAVFLFPGAGALALVWLVAFQAIVTGILLLVLGMRARKWQEAQKGARTSGRPGAGLSDAGTHHA